MRFNKELVLRTLNRFDELGGFDMKCLDHEYDSPEEALDVFYNFMRTKDTDEIDRTFRKYILMSDEEFNKPFTRMKAKAALEIFDINHRPNTINIFKLF